LDLLSDVITYVRRIIKTPSNTSISNELIIDYINRFWINDVDARIQLFDLKTKYQFQTTPGVDKYNMPLYSIQLEDTDSEISYYPVYQGFISPAYINGVQVPLQTQPNLFYNIYPNIVQNLQVIGTGDNTPGPYSLTIPIAPNNTTPINPPVSSILRGHVDIAGVIATGTNPIVDPPVTTEFITDIPTTSVDSCVFITSIDATGANVVVADSGQFLASHVNYGLLMSPGGAPFGNTSLGTYNINSNTINYLTGELNVTFPVAIPDGANINAQVYYFQTGLPRSILFYNNVLTLRAPPSTQYLVELYGYLTPAAFLSTTTAIPFGYMSEYIARGAARKILSDTGDMEQFQFYEPLFKEQEMLVWKRAQRQFTANRTETIYSQGAIIGQNGTNTGGGTL